MAADNSKKRLGRGLAALIGDDFNENAPANDAGLGLQYVSLEKIVSSDFNPRKAFSEAEIAELAKSISEKGLLQPILVRQLKNDTYEIVAGERRWRAAQKASLHDVPVIIRELEDGEALEIAIIENVQRTDLNPVEEARGYQNLIDRFGYTQQEVSTLIGKSRSHITNTLRLMNLPASVLDMLIDGKLSAGHARALLASDTPEAMAEKIVQDSLSVRDAERISKSPEAQFKKIAKSIHAVKDVDTLKLERSISDKIGLKVDIEDKGEKGGSLKISYMTLEQLDDVCRRLKGER